MNEIPHCSWLKIPQNVIKFYNFFHFNAIVWHQSSETNDKLLSVCMWTFAHIDAECSIQMKR